MSPPISPASAGITVVASPLRALGPARFLSLVTSPRKRDDAESTGSTPHESEDEPHQRASTSDLVVRLGVALGLKKAASEGAVAPDMPPTPVRGHGVQAADGPSAMLAKGRSRSRSPPNPDSEALSSSAYIRTRSGERPSAESPGRGREGRADARAEARAETRVPAFLRQTKAEMLEKFNELEWQQRVRLMQGLMDGENGKRWAREHDEQVRLRNRYPNVQPWKENRIHLRVPATHCDYINASPIVLHGKVSEAGEDGGGDPPEKAYIATQGPKDGQFNHIWRMVWHETQGTAVIVMLTQTTEAGKDKCSQYFPLDASADTLAPSDGDEFGDGFAATVRLEELRYDERSRSTVRKLRVTVGEESPRLVWHLLFAGWPDFGVPDATGPAEERNAMLELIRLSAELNEPSCADGPRNPRIVHCSAGVGRSGTFIALDHLLGEMEAGAFDRLARLPSSSAGAFDAAEADDPVFETVDRLREQRMLMVQSELQLLYIYQVLREKWLERARVQAASRPQWPLRDDEEDDNDGEDEDFVFSQA
ncbi:MAG: hypothetical protein M1832_002516 [Thelocarpon impressellum]|nr:MAG: hypothetical protein M1832_002516 [Thelocarpon impressellum]